MTTNKRINRQINPEFSLEAQTTMLKLSYSGQIMKRPSSLENNGQKDGMKEKKRTTNNKVDGFDYTSNECPIGRPERSD